MKIGKRIVLPLMIALAAASLGFSQSGTGTSSGSGSKSSSTSNSNSNSGASAVVNMGSGGKANFIEAAPGSTGSVIPGQAVENEQCHILYMAAERKKTQSELQSYARSAKGKVYEAVGDPGQASNDGVEFVSYDPEAIAWNGDSILGHFIVAGEYLHPSIGDLAKAILRAKERTGTRRVAVQDCPQSALHSKQFMVGLGGAFSEVPGGGNSGNSAALGLNFGTSQTSVQKHDVFYILAMNDWPDGVPHTAPQEITPPPPPAPPAPPEQQSPQPQAHAETAPAPTTPQPQPTAPAPTPAPAATTASDEVPQVSVYFNFDHPKPIEGLVVEPTVMTPEGLKDNAAAIHAIQQWLESHPSKKIDVVGYACYRASDKYNWDLGGRRAEAVVKALSADEKIRGQIIEPDSNGKESASQGGTKEHNWHDRRVDFRVHGSDSSGR
jgi:hypothetical protein